MVWYITGVAFLLGLIFGSFYNVVAIRGKAGESIISPASHCMECGHKLGVLDLIPVLSWIFLHGKCRYCGAKVSGDYTKIEMLTGVSLASAVLYAGVTQKLYLQTFVAMVLVLYAVAEYYQYEIPAIMLSVIMFFVPIFRIASGVQLALPLALLCDAIGVLYLGLNLNLRKKHRTQRKWFLLLLFGLFSLPYKELLLGLGVSLLVFGITKLRRRAKHVQKESIKYRCILYGFIIVWFGIGLYVAVTA